MKSDNLLIYVNGELLPRDRAAVSVYDAGFLSGDGVFEGLRLYNGRIFKLSEHINRLLEAANALDIPLKYTEEYIRTAVKTVVGKNNLFDGDYLRLQLTRGVTEVASMDPHASKGSATLVIYPERKGPIYNKMGVKLMTSHIRRIPPDSLDQKIHTINKINSILAKLEANRLGLDDAIMLDKHGFVAETTTTNIFFVKKKVISTPYPTSCLNGLTRQTILTEAPKLGYSISEKDHSIYDIYSSDEIFLTGTVGEIVAATEVDGRIVGNGERGEVTKAISEAYMNLVYNESEPI